MSIKLTFRAYLWIGLGLFPLFMSSCKTTQVSAREKFSSELGVVMRQHDMVYVYDTAVMGNTRPSIWLDKFDQELIARMEGQIKASEYAFNVPGSLHTLYLSECVTDISLADPNTKAITGKMVCKIQGAPNDSLFFCQATFTPDPTRDYENHTLQLSLRLSQSFGRQIDSIQQASLIKKDPNLYSKPFKKSEPASIVKVLIIGAILLVAYLL